MGRRGRGGNGVNGNCLRQASDAEIATRSLQARLRVLSCTFLLLACGCGRSDATTVDVLDGYRTWALPTVDGGRPAPRAVTVAPNLERYVLDTVGRVLVFSPEAELVRSWWMPEYSIGRPEGVRVREDGTSLVADTHYHRVVVFDRDGNVLDMFGEYGRGPGQFIYPVAIELDDAGSVYVAEYGGNDRIQKFDTDGNYVSEFGVNGVEPGAFQRVSGLVWQDGTIYASDAVNHRVQAFTDEGKFIGVVELDQASDLAFPYDLAGCPDGRLVTPEYGVGRVTRIARNGRVERYGRAGRAAGEFWTPWGIDVAPDGTVLVADTGNHRMVEFRP